MNYRLLTIVTIIRVTTLLTNMLMKMYRLENQDALLSEFYIYIEQDIITIICFYNSHIENKIKPTVVNVPSIHGSHNKLNIRQCI